MTSVGQKYDHKQIVVLHAKGTTSAAIAMAVGCGGDTVRYVLRQRGLKTHSTGTREFKRIDEARMRELAATGRTCPEIAREMCLSQASVWRLAKAKKITIARSLLGAALSKPRPVTEMSERRRLPDRHYRVDWSQYDRIAA